MAAATSPIQAVQCCMVPPARLDVPSADDAGGRPGARSAARRRAGSEIAPTPAPRSATAPSRGGRRSSADGTASAERTALTPQDWIRTATDWLVHRSVDAVRVDLLAKALQVTRGSFYWHFADRDDLLQRMLLAWQDEQTEQIIARYRDQGAAPEAVVRELVELPFHGRSAIKGASVELAIRAWARRDEAARRIVDAVDAKRLAYLQELFAKLGFPPGEAKPRAFLLYGYLQSEALLRNQGAPADRQARQQFVARTLTSGRRGIGRRAEPTGRPG